MSALPVPDRQVARPLVAPTRRPSTVGVVVADPRPELRRALAARVGTAEGLRLVGLASTATEGVTAATADGAGLLLLGLRAPDALRAIRRLPADVRVLVVTDGRDPVDLVRAVRAGAHGCLAEAAAPDELAWAARLVRRSTYVSPLLSVAVLDLLVEPTAWQDDDPGSAHGLTEREAEVFALVGRGLSNPAIAELLCITPKTVKNHVRHLYAKLGVTTRAEARAEWIRARGAAPAAAGGGRC